MDTVICSDVAALHENTLCSIASNLVNVNRPCALTKEGICVWKSSYGKRNIYKLNVSNDLKKKKLYNYSI